MYEKCSCRIILSCIRLSILAMDVNRRSLHVVTRTEFFFTGPCVGQYGCGIQQTGSWGKHSSYISSSTRDTSVQGSVLGQNWVYWCDCRRSADCRVFDRFSCVIQLWSSTHLHMFLKCFVCLPLYVSECFICNVSYAKTFTAYVSILWESWLQLASE